MQVLANASDTLPNVHGIQIEEPTPEKVPDRHGEQDDDPGVIVYMPPGQYLHRLGLEEMTYVPSASHKLGSSNHEIQKKIRLNGLI